jgi:PAS domain S-box-containing protein
MSDAAAGPRRPAHRARHLGLGGYLVALAAVVLLPALGVGAAAVRAAVEGQRAALEDGLRDTARALALAVDSEVDAFRSAVATLAGSAALDGPDPDLAAFEREARRAAAVLDTAVVLLLDPVTLRQIVSTTLPPDQAARAPPLEVFRPVAETGRVLVTDLAVGAVSGRLVVGVGAPAVRDGRVRYVVAARLEPARLAGMLAAQARGGSFATVADGRNRVVARSRDHERFLGQELLPWIVAETAGHEAGLLRGPNRLGEVSLSAFRRLARAPGWMVVVGDPIAIHDAAVWRPVRALVYGGLAVLGLAVLAAVWLSRLVLRPVRDLTRHAAAVAAMEDHRPAPAEAAAAPPGRPTRVTEFERLREATLRAEEALRSRAGEVAAGEARLRAVVDSAADAILVIDAAAGGRIQSFNRAAEAIFGYAAGEAIGRLDAAALFAGGGGGAVLLDAGDGPGARRELEGRRKDGSSVPLDVATAEWRDAGGRRFVTAVVRDITARKEAEAVQRLLVREVDHRAKNALAVVQSVVRLTPAEDPRAFRAAVEARIAALARAHSLLAGQGWRAADLRALLQAEVSPHAAGGGAALRLEGPPVAVSGAAAQPIAMLAHELATNAAKHGALSVPGGLVELRWRVERRGPAAADGTLHLRWAETGGPPVAGPPGHRGFGTRVIEATVRGQLGGTIGRRWEPTGLVVEVALPLGRVVSEDGGRGDGAGLTASAA